MFLEIQTDIGLKCHVTASFILKCRNQFHTKSCCLSDREKKYGFADYLGCYVGLNQCSESV